jgi:hypothetical protein
MIGPYDPPFSPWPGAHPGSGTCFASDRAQEVEGAEPVHALKPVPRRYLRCARWGDGSGQGAALKAPGQGICVDPSINRLSLQSIQNQSLANFIAHQ